MRIPTARLLYMNATLRQIACLGGAVFGGMGSSAPALLAMVGGLITASSTSGQLHPVGPAEVCKDFSDDRYPGLPWTFDDCIDVWTHFEGTIGYNPHHPEADMWRDTAIELRQKGSPCLMSTVNGGDGLGSTTIRHVSTWIFAEEMGCDWITPDWGKKKAANGDGQAVRYCHAILPKDERESGDNTNVGGVAVGRCSVVDWLSYFQFDKPSVSWPSGAVKIISQASEIFQVCRRHTLQASRGCAPPVRSGSQVSPDSFEVIGPTH